MKKLFLLLSIAALLAGCTDNAEVKDLNIEDMSLEELVKQKIEVWSELEANQKNNLAIEALHDGGLTKAEYHEHFRMMINEMDRWAANPKEGTTIQDALEANVFNVKTGIKSLESKAESK